MFGFSLGNKKVLGIDIGTSALKVIELEIRDDKTPYLSNYAWMAIPEVIREDNDSEKSFFETNIPEFLKKMMKEANFKTKDAYVSISSFGGLVTLIELPEMPEKELEQAVRFEAHKYVPTSLDDVTISWEVIEGEPISAASLIGDAGASSQRKMQVLLVAAFKSRISAYEKVAKAVGLNLKGIEIESISMVESLIGNDQGNFIIIDIGFRVCNIIYVEKGTIRANRNIDAGGADITRAIAKGMGISEDRAESFKVSGKNFFNAESSLRFPALDTISSEVSRILEISSKNRSNYRLEAIILSGGTAGLAGLSEYFQSKFNVKTVMGNPFGRIAYDKKLEPLMGKMRNEFAVCVGLALKEIENNAK
ncbi:MAG: type IV pilus assembly protein PilM [Parcubacteria group bacterium]